MHAQIVRKQPVVVVLESRSDPSVHVRAVIAARGIRHELVMTGVTSRRVELSLEEEGPLSVQWAIEGPRGSAYECKVRIIRADGTQVDSDRFAGHLSDAPLVRVSRLAPASASSFEGMPASGDDGFLSGGSAPPPGRVTRGSRDTRSTKKKPDGDRAEYVVWYATNRKRVDPRDASKGYSAERAAEVEYGSCRVFVPKSHKIGSTGSPWWKRLLTLTDDRLRLLSIDATSRDEHWREIAGRIAAVARDQRQALLFIHGYNVSFQDAALRAAQLGFDLSIRGAMAFFSWPSQGTLDGYLADSATIEASEEAIADYLSDFAVRSGAETVHVIAHSMGNRGVLRAVNRIATAAQERTGVQFGQFILAAADVDADTFRSLAAAYGRVARRTTLYVSDRDRAVEASRWLHHFPRVGLAPPVLVIPGIDTVSVTNADLTLLGHGYVAEARDVLHDIHALIRHGAPPESRFGLREAHTESGDRYWLIGK